MAGFTPQPLAAFVGDASASVRMSVPSGVSSLAFDEARSVIWVGLEDGRVVAFEFPTARVYSSVQLHRGRVRKLLAFPGGLGGGIVSLSSSRLCLHTVKGMLINEWSAKANHGGQTDIFKSLRCCTLFAMGDQPCIALSGGSGGKRGDDASSTTAKQRSDGGFGRVVLFVRAQPMLDRAGNPWKKGSEPFARIKLPYDVTSLASATPVRQSFNAVAENIVVGTSTGDVYTVELRLLGQRAGGQIQAMLVGTPRRHFQLSRPVSCLAVQGRMLASASGTLPGSIQPPVHLRDLVTQRQHDAGAPPMHGRRYQIAFIPTTSDTSPVEMVVATNSGSWSICAPGAGAPAQVHRLAFAAHAGPSCRLVALAAAPSGQMIAFGDSAGVVHLFKSGGLAAELPSVHAGFVAVPLGAHPAKVPAPASFSAPPVPRSSADPTTGAPTTTWELPPALGGRLAIFPPPRSQFFDLCSELPPYEVDQVMMRHARRTVATKLKEAAQSEGSGDFLSFIANEKSAGFGFVPPNSMLFGERKDEAYDVVDPRLTEAEEGDYASAAPRKWTPVPGVPVEYTRPEIVLGKVRSSFLLFASFLLLLFAHLFFCLLVVRPLRLLGVQLDAVGGAAKLGARLQRGERRGADAARAAGAPRGDAASSGGADQRPRVRARLPLSHAHRRLVAQSDRDGKRARRGPALDCADELRARLAADERRDADGHHGAFHQAAQGALSDPPHFSSPAAGARGGRSAPRLEDQGRIDSRQVALRIVAARNERLRAVRHLVGVAPPAARDRG